MESPLTPTQALIVEQLRRPDISPPAFEADLADQLTEAIEDELSSLADLSPTKNLFISKHPLSTIHACEAHYLATSTSFEWSIPTARGSVAHRAIELSIHWRGEAVPLELVDEAMARMVDETRGPGAWLATLREADRAQLRSEVGDLVTKFMECFPPLKPVWRPVSEGGVYHDLLGGALTLQGKPDLTLGQAPDKVIIDFKTGRPALAHRDDLRFYALVETLARKVPPRLTGTLYLDAARVETEPVSSGGLWAAARRMVDAVTKIVEVERQGRAAARSAGPMCRWCPLMDECDEGRVYLAGLDDY